VRGYIESQTNRYVPFEYDSVKVDVSKKAFDVVRKGMYKVVQGEGTARWIRMKDIEICGKTGTAQNPHGEDHALFIAFAPYENPKIAVAVIVENVGYGSTYAAPVAKKIIKAYLDPENKKLNLLGMN
jgi:penicillin-binding protein 2